MLSRINATLRCSNGIGDLMACRIRHCVSCPHCLNRYLIGFSPYANGSYVVSTQAGGAEEYVLYCSCRQFPAPSRWKESEVRACAVSNFAYRRGFGSPDEILFVDQRGEPADLYTQMNSKVS
jgi:hypothetical protein